MVQPSEEEQEDTGAPDPDFQDEDYFEDQVAAAEFDDTLPVGGLMVRGSAWVLVDHSMLASVAAGSHVF